MLIIEFPKTLLMILFLSNLFTVVSFKVKVVPDKTIVADGKIVSIVKGVETTGAFGGTLFSSVQLASNVAETFELKDVCGLRQIGF